MKRFVVPLFAVLCLTACKGHIDGGMRADSFQAPHLTNSGRYPLASSCRVFNDYDFNDDTRNSISAQADAHRSADAAACRRR